MNTAATVFIVLGCLGLAGGALCRLPVARRVAEWVIGSDWAVLAALLVALLASGFVGLPGEGNLAWGGELGGAAPEEKTPAALAAEAPLELGEDAPQIPAGRPEWIGKPPSVAGEVHTIPVASGPYASEGEARRALDKELVAAVGEYLVDEFGSPLASQYVRYDARTIKRRYVKADNVYHDVATYSVGPMHEYFALVEFDAAARREMALRWARAKGQSRLMQAGLGAAVVLLLLASVAGYFRFDHATRGYYSRRLQLLTAVAILAVVGVGAALAHWIPWL